MMLVDLPLKIASEDNEFDEDYFYSALKESGMDEMECDRALNDKVHGLSMGIALQLDSIK